MIIIILNQTELWYKNSIGTGRYSNSGIGSEGKKMNEKHLYGFIKLLININ